MARDLEQTAPTRQSHPLAETFDRLPGAGEEWGAQLGAPPDRPWITARSLVDPETAALDRCLAQMAAEYRTDNPEVLARFFFGGYVYYVALAAAGAFTLARRAPELAIANIGFEIGEWGSPRAVIIRHGRFACLPDDPAARHPDATVLPDVASLRARLRDDLVQFCQPLIDVLRTRAKLGARALWIDAAETCATAILESSPDVADEGFLRHEIAALIGDPTSPLRAKPELVLLEANGHRRLISLRNSCCTNFKIPGEDYCTNCPHRDREDRLHRLREWVAGLPDEH